MAVFLLILGIGLTCYSHHIYWHKCIIVSGLLYYRAWSCWRWGYNNVANSSVASGAFLCFLFSFSYYHLPPISLLSSWVWKSLLFHASCGYGGKFASTCRIHFGGWLLGCLLASYNSQLVPSLLVRQCQFWVGFSWPDPPTHPFFLNYCMLLPEPSFGLRVLTFPMSVGVCPKVCVRQPRACPDNLSLVQGSQSLDHRWKTHWLKSLFLGGDCPWNWKLTLKSQFIPFWICGRYNSSSVEAKITKFGPEVQNTFKLVKFFLFVDSSLLVFMINLKFITKFHEPLDCLLEEIYESCGESLPRPLHGPHCSMASIICTYLST